MRIAAVMMAAAIGTASGVAQDSRADAARLHELVDRRIEELRAELHREIDAALGTAEIAKDELGLTCASASDEFRELFRLPAGSGLRITGVTQGRGARDLGLIRGDVVLYTWTRADDRWRWVMSKADLLATLRGVDSTRSFGWVAVIRKGELLVTGGGHLSPAGLFQPFDVGQGEVPKQETASEMVDRLWDKAVRDAVKGGFEQINPGNPVSESQPRRK